MIIKNKTSLKTRQIITNQSGQALLLVLVTMVVALAVGVGVSLRTLSSVSRVSTTDTASRALAAAEAGVERYLSYGAAELDLKANADAPEVIQFAPEEESDDTIITQATVEVTEFGGISSPDFFELNIDENELVEIILISSATVYDAVELDVCWSSSGATGTELYFTGYFFDASAGDYSTLKDGVTTNFSPPSAPYSSNFNDPIAGRDGFNECYSLDLSPIRTAVFNAANDRAAVRIQSLAGPSKIGIYPTDGETLPVQGYTITSIGELTNVATDLRVTKEVQVIKLFPFTPGPFGFAVYSNTGALQ